MKELKFTPENLKRHFMNAPRMIWTTRAKKYNIGDKFKIIELNGRESVFKIYSYSTYPREDIDTLVYYWWKREGFASQGKFKTELLRIYPDAEKFYVYELLEVFPKYTKTCSYCRYFSDSGLYSAVQGNDYWNFCDLHKNTTKRLYSCSKFESAWKVAK